MEPFYKLRAGLLRRTDLTAIEKLILINIAFCQGANKDAWPSLATLAKWCVCHKKTVVAAIRKLESLGFFTVNRNSGLSSRYSVAESSKLNRCNPSPGGGGTGVNEALDRCNPSPGTGVIRAHELDSLNYIQRTRNFDFENLNPGDTYEQEYAPGKVMTMEVVEENGVKISRPKRGSLARIIANGLRELP